MSNMLIAIIDLDMKLRTGFLVPKQELQEDIATAATIPAESW